MTATLVLADYDGEQLKPATASAVTAARALGHEVDLLVAGAACRSVAEQAARLEGIRRVLMAEDPALGEQLAEPLAALLVSLRAEYGAFLAPATSTGKNVMPRFAALIDVMQVSDVTAIRPPATFERLIYAGNAVQTLTSRDERLVVTVRPSAFPPVAAVGEAPIETLAVPPLPVRTRFRKEARSASDRPDLSAARVVVSGGRGLGSASNFETLLAPLAHRFAAAIGASRAAVDSGYAPNELQVGQTGRIVAPDLYVAVGISGAIQHLAGMKDSKIIVAINRDADAPIFSIADYGLVGDLFELVPELERALDPAS